jgi:hypothetical protein
MKAFSSNQFPFFQSPFKALKAFPSPVHPSRTR